MARKSILHVHNPTLHTIYHNVNDQLQGQVALTPVGWACSNHKAENKYA